MDITISGYYYTFPQVERQAKAQTRETRALSDKENVLSLSGNNEGHVFCYGEEPPSR